jgi:hypothetical protein
MRAAATGKASLTGPNVSDHRAIGNPAVAERQPLWPRADISRAFSNAHRRCARHEHDKQRCLCEPSKRGHIAALEAPSAYNALPVTALDSSSANRSAAPHPMPLAAPVTIHVLSCKRMRALSRRRALTLQKN